MVVPGSSDLISTKMQNVLRTFLTSFFRYLFFSLRLLNIFFMYTCMSKPNKRSCRFFGIFCRVPLLTGLSSKCHNFFSIWSLLSSKKYVRQKYPFCLFSKKNWFVCFPPFLLSLFKKLSPFCQKLRILAGNRQTTKKILNEKFECFRCFFICWLY